MSEGQLLCFLPRMPSFQPQLSVSLFSFPMAMFWYYLRCSSPVGFSAVLTLLFIPVHFFLAKTSGIFVLHLLPSPLLEVFELENHFLLVLLLSGAFHNAWQWVVPTRGCIEERKDEVSCSYLGCVTHTDRDLLTCWSHASWFYLKDKVST